MSIANEIWMMIVALATRPETSGLATAFAAMFTFVASWRFVPTFLGEIPALQREQLGMGFVRMVVSLGLIAALTAASAGLMRMLPHL